MLREILGYCTGADPGDLRFGCNAFGKPFLKGIARQESPCFNLSHSGELLLVAVALGREVGIDLERLRGGLDFRSLAQRFFSKRETSSLLALPADRRKEAFFACWTRKEACVKAFGRGLAFPLEQFDVSVHPDRAAKLLAIRGGQLPHRRWRLADLPAPPGYAAALAAEGGAFRFRQWQWSRCAGTAAG